MELGIKILTLRRYRIWLYWVIKYEVGSSDSKFCFIVLRIKQHFNYYCSRTIVQLHNVQNKNECQCKMSTFIDNKLSTSYLYVYYIDSPKGCKFCLKGSLLLHTLYFIGTALSTVVNRFRFDSRGLELIAPHLESALDEQLQSWFARPISGATSVSYLTGETSISGIEPETRSQSFGHHTKALALSFWTYSFRWVRNHQESEKHLKKIHWCWPGSNPGRLISSLTFYPMCHCAPSNFILNDPI